MNLIRIDEIDKNLKVETSIDKEDIVWLSPKEAPFSVHGLCEVESDEPYHRIPRSVAEATNAGVRNLMWHTAGGRIRFATDSPYVAIKAVMPATATMTHIAKTGQSGFDLYASDGTNSRYAGTFRPPYEKTPGFESILNTSGKMCTYTINMPLYDGVQELYIGLARTANLAPAESYLHTVPILYYGSSITQGGCASRPGNAYQNIITRLNRIDHINLGFSGRAKAEDAMIDYIKDLEMSLFVYDYDHNAPTPEHLANTHEKMFRAIRAQQPELPIIMLSRPKIYLDESEQKRLAIIQTTYQNALAAGDRNVYFIQGSDLMAQTDNDGTVDGTHPNDYGFHSMARVLGACIHKILDK